MGKYICYLREHKNIIRSICVISLIFVIDFSFTSIVAAGNKIDAAINLLLLSEPPTTFSGYYNDGTKNIPCSWIGTTRIDLAGNGTNDAYAFSPTVSFNGMVYTAGYYNDGTKEIPCYWTGTTRTDLVGDGTHDAKAYSIAVSSDGTIYTSGYYNDGTKDIPCYWAGSTRTDLAGNGTDDARAYSVAVSSDGTVYMAGYYKDGTKKIPCYWAGSTRTDLAGDGTHSAEANSIAVFNGIVYTAGVYNDGTKDIPCYWTGTTRTGLAGDSTHSAQVISAMFDPPNFVKVAGNGIIFIYHYSDGSFSGVTAEFYMKNIGGSGVINVTVTAGGYTENTQFNVADDTQYTLYSLIPATLGDIVSSTNSLPVSASISFREKPGLTITLSLGPMYKIYIYYPSQIWAWFAIVPNGTPSSSLGVDK